MKPSIFPLVSWISVSTSFVFLHSSFVTSPQQLKWLQKTNQHGTHVVHREVCTSSWPAQGVCWGRVGGEGGSKRKVTGLLATGLGLAGEEQKLLPLREMAGFQIELLAAPRQWNAALCGPHLVGSFLLGKAAKQVVTAVQCANLQGSLVHWHFWPACLRLVGNSREAPMLRDPFSTGTHFSAECLSILSFKREITGERPVAFLVNMNLLNLCRKEKTFHSAPSHRRFSPWSHEYTCLWVSYHSNWHLSRTTTRRQPPVWTIKKKNSR